MNRKQIGICDKCNQKVDAKNDLGFYLIQLAKVFNDDNYLTWSLCAGSRHLLPTSTCEGSPSRAQYIQGQPKDSRGFIYEQEKESLYREAYNLLQQMETV